MRQSALTANTRPIDAVTPVRMTLTPAGIEDASATRKRNEDSSLSRPLSVEIPRKIARHCGPDYAKPAPT